MQPPKTPSPNDIGTRRSSWEVTDLRRLVSPVRPVYPDHEPFPADAPWIRIRSRVLAEEIVLVLRRDAVREAEEACPDVATYVVPEMDILRDFEGKPEVIRRLHAIKKEMRGWLVRPEE
ncbi:MAG: hypothetical protein ABIH26_08810 [Candidatus Eisenbacteria bacterium]